MVSTAKGKFIRISPRKMRYVLDLVRTKSVIEAYSILDRTSRRPCLVVRKLIQQAADSAVKQKQLPLESLYISKTFADGAGMMKRFRSMSMGRAGMIRKRLSHVTVELDSRAGVPVKAASAKAHHAPAHTQHSKPAKGKGPAASGAEKKKTHKKAVGAK